LNEKNDEMSDKVFIAQIKNPVILEIIFRAI
jgi:hypothetical protein